MERLNLLSVALGLACLAGLNLYLTVFATGVAIHWNWIALTPQFESLRILGDPWIIGIAGALFALEFLADKIPWLDSAWDTVHTFIRPIGGALLAIQTLGHPSPTFDVIVALLAGTTSLAAHTAKATTRLVANTSPEPFSNIALSLGEDLAVVGGLALLHAHPIAAFSIFLVALATFAWFAPRVLRAAKVKLWLIWRKLNDPAAFFRSERNEALPLTVPPQLGSIFSRENVLGETIAWAVPCVSGHGRKIPPNLFGALVATHEESRKLIFVAQKGARGFARTIELDGLSISRQPKFLSENLVLYREEKRPSYLFLFPRSRAAEVEKIAASLSPAVEPAVSPVVDVAS